MNKELIQKFLDKACWDQQAQYELEDWLNVEKFAELIVKECVGICECEWNGDADTFAASEAYNECADAIKEHFGVKE
jgi:hypothetical protein